MSEIKTKKKTIILLLLILGIAAIFRLWQLEYIPPGLYPDEAINGNDAIDALKNDFKVFYPENNGREGLFINLIALSFSVLGINVWTIRIVSAVIGILTVLGLYFLVKELFTQATNDKQQATSIALLSSLFLAISFWHTNLSRIGFRVILVPFLLVFYSYFLFRGFRTKKTWSFVVSGIFLGLGFYSYTVFRFVVLLLFVILFSWWLIYRNKNLQRNFISLTFCFLLATFIVALPLGIYFLKNPQDFISRATGVSIFAQENPIKAFGKSLILHLGMFNFYGDGNWRHNFSESPQLFWPIGILFLIGLCASIKNLFFSIKKKDWSIFLVYCSILSWFFVMLLPSVLTYEAIPHALRTAGVIPVIYIFSAIGAYRIYKIFQKNIPQKTLLCFVCFLFLIIMIFAQAKKYFIDWAKRPEISGAFSENYVKIGEYLNSLPPEIQKYVIVNQSGVLIKGIPMPAQTVMFIESTKFGKPRSLYLLPENLDQIKTNKNGLVIVPLLPEKQLFDKIEQKFISGKVQEKQWFQLYEIK